MRTVNGKIIIYDAIIRSKLLYGLETIQLTTSMKKELDAFQLRGLRQILKRTHTNWNREHTNKYILDLASKTAYPNKPNKKIKLFSEFQLERKLRLYGQIIRASDLDPLKAVAFKDNHLDMNEWNDKRVGRPKQDWIWEAAIEVWTTILNKQEPFEYPDEQVDEIIHAARNKVF